MIVKEQGGDCCDNDPETNVIEDTTWMSGKESRNNHVVKFLIKT